MKLLSENELRSKCSFKWHDNIPINGISLGVADIDFSGPDGIIEYITDNLEDSYAFYQEQSGQLKTRETVSNFLKKSEIQSKADNIQIIPGTMIGIYGAMKFASNRGGRVICLGPIYEPIHKHATENGNDIEWIDLHSDNELVDEITNKLNGDVSLIAICNPSNPSGYIYSEAELRTIGDLAHDYNITCFSDELYQPLDFNNKFKSILTQKKIQNNSIVLYGFSKAYGLAGYRSGFMYIGDNIANQVKDIIQFQLVSPSPIASIVCNYALTDDRSKSWVTEFSKMMSANTKLATQIFRDHGYDCYQPDGCFFVFPNLQTEDSVFTKLLLEKEGVQVVEGSLFGPMGRNHVRINCATSEERLTNAIYRIINLLKENK